MGAPIGVTGSSPVEIPIPETFRKGEEFESYVRNKLFPKEKYIVLQRTHGFLANQGDFIESSKEPDFEFRSLGSGRSFLVEAKYRSNYYRDAIPWCKPYQLRRYQEIDQKAPVFVVLGVGEKPDAPEQVFLIPVRQIKYPKLFPSFLKQYEVRADRHIDENQLRLEVVSPVEATTVVRS